MAQLIRSLYRADLKTPAGREGWQNCSTIPVNAPNFSAGQSGLTVTGNGKTCTFGWWSRRVPVEGGKTYSLRVAFSVRGIDDISLHILNLLTWRLKNRPESSPPQDHVTYFRREGDLIIGEQEYRCSPDTEAVDLQLLLRHSPEGSVTWHTVELTEVEAPPPRPVRVSCSKARMDSCANLAEFHQKTVRMIEKAASEASDLVLLPEAANAYDANKLWSDFAEPVPGGDYCRLLSSLAEKHRINLAAGMIELAEDGVIYNTCVLFDRKGEFVGKYRKTHLYWPETMFHGITPGDDSPVFDLDIGRVGVMICYDSWYGETARLLALKGAEIVLFPNAGYETKILPARAIDNNLYIVCSSLCSSAQILNTRGECLASLPEESAFEVTTAGIDLSVRELPHANAGGSMNPGCGGRRAVRNSPSDRLYREIVAEMATWEDRRESYTWLK